VSIERVTTARAPSVSMHVARAGVEALS
jgi:hypothetical protein